MYHEVTSPPPVGTHTIPCLVCAWGTAQPIPFWWCSHSLLESHHLHVQISSVQDSRGLHCSSQELSPTVWLLLSGILAALASPNSHLSSLLSKTETAGLSLGFAFLSLSPETKAGSRLGRAWSRKGHCVCFPSIRNHSCTLPGIRCQKTVLFHIFHRVF